VPRPSERCASHHHNIFYCKALFATLLECFFIGAIRFHQRDCGPVALLQAKSATASRGEVRTMTNLSDLTVLIVDLSRLDGSELRRMFVNACAATHVAETYAAARKLVESTKIDAVLLPFSTDAETISFCKMLSQKSIPRIFTSEPPPRCSKRRAMSEVVIAIHAVLAQRPPVVRGDKQRPSSRQREIVR
jgi:hypothetical protein